MQKYAVKIYEDILEYKAYALLHHQVVNLVI